SIMPFRVIFTYSNYFISKLIKHIEEFAIEKECSLINLDTFSFQAPAFYKKHGYKVIGVSENHPKGNNRHPFISK
ncbi:hypothetical protein ACT4UT_33640, partial [Bacillus sp. B-TM1]